MKKLMTLIGAVATAFGLFAADPVVTGSASFESVNEFPGMFDQDLTTFTPASPWSWAGDPLTLGDYGTDNVAYVYPGNGNTRRTFMGDPAQDKYLKLETTKSEKLEFAAITGQSIFVDQLVQFTGFEEAPAVGDAKIAVWMSEFVTQEENEAEQLPELTETNLYITAGIDSAASAKASVKINGTYEIGKWYRLTIKSLGVIDGDATVGFIVYIDGQQVGSSDEAAKALINPGLLNEANAALLADGKLFPAMTTGAIASVGYNGIGAIDDIVIDDQGPEFARKIPFTANETEMLAILSIKDAAGNDVVPADGVANGTVVTVTYGPQAGYKILGTANTATLAITEAGLEITPGDDIDVKAVVAKLNNTTDLAESELLATINAFKENDVLAILKACNVFTEDVEPVQLYGFTPNTTITVTAAGWNVYVGNYNADDGEGGTVETAGMFTANVDIAAGTTMSVRFEDATSGMFMFGGAAVNGQLIGLNGTTIAMTEVTVGAAGLIQAANFMPGAAITLVEAGKVKSDVQLAYTGDGKVFANEEEIEELPQDTDGYYTYQIKAEEPEPTTGGFAIIIAGDDETTTTNYYETLDLAIAAAGTEDPVKGQLPAVVTLLENATLTAACTINKALTIDLNGKTVTGDWDAGLNGVAGSRVYMFECGANAVTFENGTIASTANNIGALHTQGGNLTVNAIVNTKWRAIGAYDGATVVVGANAVLTTAGEDPTIFIWSNFANRSDTTVQCDVTIAGKVYNTFNGTRTSANLDAVIMGSGNDKGAGVKLTVADGAEISGTACAGIYFPCAGLLEIDAASITGTEGVYVKGGASTVVNGAVITATGTANAFVADHNGHAWTGDAFVVDVSEGYAAVATQSISGGTFTSVNGAAVASYKEAGATADRVTGFISGGSFRGAIDPAVDLIAIGSGMDTAKWKPTEDGYVVPFAFTAVAQIGNDGEKFESLAAAVAAVPAATATTVTLLANTTENITIPAGKVINLALNGKTLTGKTSTYTINNNGTLTLGGGTVNDAVTPQNTLIRNGANATMTINDGTYVSHRIVIKNDENNNKAGSISGTGGTLIINGGTFTTEGDGVYNWDALLNWGTATIKGGTFNGVIECAAYDYWQGGVATITGGKFNSKVITIAYFNGNAAPTFNPALTISGGTFEYPVYRNIGPYADNPDPANYFDVDTAVLPEPYASAENQGQMTIGGGTAQFKTKPADAVIAEGYKFVKLDQAEYWTVAALQNYDITFKVEGQADYVTNVVEGTEVATVKPADPVVEGKTFTAWAPALEGVVESNATYTAQFTANTYMVSFYTNNAFCVTASYTFGDAQSFTTPTVEGVEAWYTDTTYTTPFAVNVNQANDDQKAYAQIAAEPDFPLDPTDDKLDENGEKAVVTAKEVFGDGLNAYVAKVYGEGEGIPASKLNGTTEDLIKIAKEYELPIMVAPTVEIKQAASGVGFEFQILDENVPVALQEAKILSMVEFTTAIGDTTKPFETATLNDVTVAIKEESANKTATVDFTKETAAGFMRVNLKAEK